MTIKDACTAIETRLPRGMAEDFDNTGLLCGHLMRECTGILVCHDVTEKVVAEAAEKNINLIVAFHPIIFQPLKKITGSTYVENTVMAAMEEKIAIYAVHTALDNDFFGVNHRICTTLGLSDIKVLMPKKSSLFQFTVFVPQDHAEGLKSALYAAGAGQIGFYDQCSFSVSGQGTFRPLAGSNPYLGSPQIQERVEEQMVSVIFEDYKKDQIITTMKAAHPYEEVAYQILRTENDNSYEGLGQYGLLPHPMEVADFLSLVKEKFHLKMIRYNSKFPGTVQKVGVLGGSGASGIGAAISAGCDAYITGDLKYHEFFRAHDRMLLCDIGHQESEQFVVQQLFEILSDIFPKFAVSKSIVNTNPVNYFF